MTDATASAVDTDYETVDTVYMLATRTGLRERLLEAARDLLEREGVEGVTLRAIARRAGVSHGAPLRHYPTLSALLSEVAAEGFRVLHDAVDAAAGRTPPPAPARERLAAAGRAYVEAAVAHPSLFTLMFRPDRLDWSVPELLRESNEAFEQVARLVRAAQDDGWHAEADTRVLAGTVWASVHGLATLWAWGAMQGVTNNDSLERAIATTVDVVAGDHSTGGDR